MNDVSKLFIIHQCIESFTDNKGRFILSVYSRTVLKSVIMFFDNVNVLCSLSLYNLFAVRITTEGAGNSLHQP